MAFFAIGVAGYAIYGYLILTPGDTVSLAQKAVYAVYRMPIIFHVLFTSLALVLGIPQMSKKFRERLPKTNVNLRRIYFVSVITGGITGLILSFYAQGGLVNHIGFAMLSIIWLYSCAMSISAIQKNDMGTFRVWIVRNYTLTLAAVTLRIFLGLLWSFYEFKPEYFEEIYRPLGFLCWVPNIMITEWLILTKIKVNRN